MSKNIVLISYATYPSNSPRHFRTDELAKQLSKDGNNVTLYVLKGNYDYSEYEKKYNLKVNSLGKTFFFNFDPEKGFRENILFKCFRKIFHKIFEFPNIELSLNVFNVLKKHKNVDMVISIAVPYPLHWGVAIYRKFQKNKKFIWIADCGDPYMGSDFHKKPYYFKYVEKFSFKHADYITVPLESSKKGYYSEFHDKIKVIPQGFDFNDIQIKDNYNKNSIPTFIYAGIFYENLRDPRPLLDFLLKLDLDFKFIVYTKNKFFLSSYEEKMGCKLEINSYIDRKELIYIMSKADFLLNLDNPSEVHSPSKLIDYSLAKRPILSINTNNELNEQLILDFISGDYSNATILNNMSDYDIKNIANAFLKLS